VVIERSVATVIEKPPGAHLLSWRLLVASASFVRHLQCHLSAVSGIFSNASHYEDRSGVLFIFLG